MRCDSLDVSLTVEELGLSGEISLGKCSRSTAYRDMRRVNDYLNHNRYEWRVKLIVDNNSYLPYTLVVS